MDPFFCFFFLFFRRSRRRRRCCWWCWWCFGSKAIINAFIICCELSVGPKNEQRMAAVNAQNIDFTRWKRRWANKLTWKQSICDCVYGFYSLFSPTDSVWWWFHSSTLEIINECTGFSRQSRTTTVNFQLNCGLNNSDKCVFFPTYVSDDGGKHWQEIIKLKEERLSLSTKKLTLIFRVALWSMPQFQINYKNVPLRVRTTRYFVSIRCCFCFLCVCLFFDPTMTNSGFATISRYKLSKIYFEMGDFQQLICFYNESFFF